MGAPGVAVAFCRSKARLVRWCHRGGGCLFRSLLSLNRYAALRVCLDLPW